MAAIRARLVASATSLSEVFDFFVLTFLGDVFPGIDQPSSIKPLLADPPLLFMSKPFRAFVIANMSAIPPRGELGDISPGIGGCPGASMKI